MSMTPEQFWRFSAKSYKDANTELILPTDQGIFGIERGAQFTGVCCVGDTLAFASYYHPAVLLEKWRIVENRLILNETRIGGVTYRTPLEVKRRRMFQDFPYPADANRMQTVVMRSDRELGLVRGTERAVHWIDKRDDGAWHFRTKETLPDNGFELIHSAVLLDDGQLWTSEGRKGFEEAGLCKYRDGIFIETAPMLLNMFGIAVRQSDGAMFTITDHLFKGEHGIYIDGTLKVPDVIGHGIALLDDGRAGAIVTVYGESDGSALGGGAGGIVYIPPDLLS